MTNTNHKEKKNHKTNTHLWKKQTGYSSILKRHTLGKGKHEEGINSEAHPQSLHKHFKMLPLTSMIKIHIQLKSLNKCVRLQAPNSFPKDKPIDYFSISDMSNSRKLTKNGDLDVVENTPWILLQRRNGTVGNSSTTKIPGLGDISCFSTGLLDFFFPFIFNHSTRTHK